MLKVRIFYAALIALGACTLAACSTTQQSSAANAAAKVQVAVAKACPIAKTVVTAIAGQPGVSIKLQVDLVQAQALITTACAGNATLDVTTAQALASTGIPAMIADVNATSMPDSTKATINGALTATSVILQVLLAQ